MLLRLIPKMNAVIVRIQEVLTAVFLTAMVVLVTLQMVLRIFKIATPWADEGSRIAMIWLVFFGAAGMLIKGEHLCVDVFYARFNETLKKVLRVVYDGAVLLFVLVMFFYGCELLSAPMIYKSTTQILQISLVWYYISLPISMLVMAVYEIGDLVMAVSCLMSHASSKEGLAG